jgi:hypothetical protein
MEGDLKQLLRDRADEARVEPTIPPVVLRRARRRRVGTVAITGLVVAAVGATALVGVRAFSQEAPIAPSDTGGWRGIWPQDTREEAQEAQQQAVDQTRIEPGCTAQGPECLVPPDLWQLDAEEVVVRYARQVLGWEKASVTADLEPLPDEPGPVKRLVKRCAAHVFCAPQDSALVTVERLLRSDRTGLWFVTAWESPAPNASVVAFVSDFLQARIAGSGAERFLSAEAERTYREERDGLSLYGGDRGGYGGFDIYTHPRETETGWSIVVLVKWPDPQGEEDRFVADTLELGAGRDLQGQPQPLLVLSVSRNHEVEGEVRPPQAGDIATPGQDGAAGPEVSFLTWSAEKVRALPQALLVNETLVRHDGCLFARDIAGEDLLLLWPPAFRFEYGGDGRVVDPVGDVVATVGGPLPRMGGGVFTADFAEQALMEGTIPESCRGSGESVWMVGEIEGHPAA